MQMLWLWKISIVTHCEELKGTAAKICYAASLYDVCTNSSIFIKPYRYVNDGPSQINTHYSQGFDHFLESTSNLKPNYEWCGRHLRCFVAIISQQWLRCFFVCININFDSKTLFLVHEEVGLSSSTFDKVVMVARFHFLKWLNLFNLPDQRKLCGNIQSNWWWFHLNTIIFFTMISIVMVLIQSSVRKDWKKWWYDKNVWVEWRWRQYNSNVQGYERGDELQGWYILNKTGGHDIITNTRTLKWISRTFSQSW